jgi:septum formation protein
MIILASASPRRQKLLKEWGVKFKTVPSRIIENTVFKAPYRIVTDLALQKAESVAKNFKAGIVIGADTIVVLKGEIIGKPDNPAHAARILAKLNGSYHRVYSGIAVIDAATRKTRTAFEVSRVKMRKLSSDEISKFSHKHLDKAGAYAVQEKGDAFVEKIEGDYFNVVGLPYDKLKAVLSGFNIKLRKIAKR